MARFALRLTADDPVSATEAASSFYWLSDRARSSFYSSVDPYLSDFGPVPPRNVDLVRIALTALAADRSVHRAGRGSNWNQRHFELEIPVSDPGPWARAAAALQHVLALLSGDTWELSFVPQPDRAPFTTAPLASAPARVVLLSGGADSALGAVHSRRHLAEGEHHLLLSHFSNTMLPPIQKHIAAEAMRLVPGGAQEHRIVRLSRRTRRIDGTPYPSEPTTRSRSLLFIALGLAVASLHHVPLWIPENGFASLNPPLGPERLGSLSTRTTHPAFLQDLSAAATAAGAHAVLENPFARHTKGEMFQQAAGFLGAEKASAFLSATHSCGLTGQRAHSIPAQRQCGVCFGCVLRRASFTAANLRDRTDYIAPSSDAAVQDWLRRSSVEQPVRNLLRRGIRNRDLIALDLPHTYPLREARDLCVRGLKDLRSLYP
ncbi:hypothetical protein [Streptomyces demainii]|uniref:7-cyano-7-deazaguanine synthase n=1 Tax=Streptomyces demainii TaxID=588122 RepID=A0ABT9KWQ1_9ACTN|nr:hypothetical protein [Streptomyces demainii]MDP9612864.1 hypothetical protein [Streptomyces demainii]